MVSKMLRIFAFLFASLVVLGTAAVSDAKTAQESYAGRVIFVPKLDAAACKGGQALPLLAALLPIVVKQGLSFIQKLIADKAASYEATVSATSADTFLVNCGSSDTPNMQPRVSGIKFGYGPVSGTVPKDFDSRYKALGFTGIPKFYIEGRFEFVESAATQAKGENKQVVAIRYAKFIPTTLEYNGVLAKSGTDKDLLLALTFNFPSAYEENNAKQSTTSSNVTTPPSEGKTKPEAKKEADAKKEGDPKTTAAGDVKKVDGGDGGKANKAAAGSARSDSATTASSTQATISGSTETVVLPLFEHMTAGVQITLDTLSTGWFLLPHEQPIITIQNKDVTLPVNLSVVVKETDAGHGADVWLAVSDALANNSSSLASAILGKSQSTSTKSGSSDAAR